MPSYNNFEENFQCELQKMKTSRWPIFHNDCCSHDTVAIMLSKMLQQTFRCYKKKATCSIKTARLVSAAPETTSRGCLRQGREFRKQTPWRKSSESVTGGARRALRGERNSRLRDQRATARKNTQRLTRKFLITHRDFPDLSQTYLASWPYWKFVQ